MTIIRIKLTPKSEPPKRYIGWRCKHKGEPGAPDNPANSGDPEVRPSDWQNGIPFTEELQRLSFDLMRWGNPLITAQNWRVVYKDDVAFTNNQSWGDNQVRADYINGLDLSAPLPKLMKVTICGGSLYGGIPEGDELTFRPGVDGIDANGAAIPPLETVIKNGWYFHAVTWIRNGVTSHFPQGHGGKVLIPLVLTIPVSYPLAWFERWDGVELPDPLR